jgi:hypothetical protein
MDPAIMAEAHEQALGRLADRLLRYACHLLDEGEAAEDLNDKARVGEVAAKIGRGVRQTIALQARLARDARRGAHEAAVEDDARRTKAIPLKKAEVRRAVERLVWTEFEREDHEAEQLLADLDETLLDEAFEPGFLETPTETLVARLAETFELTLPQPRPEEAVAEGASPADRANGHDSS